MQKIIIDAHDPQFKTRLNSFAFASAHILDMDLSEEDTLDLIEALQDALIEAIHEESDYQAQIAPEEPVLGYTIKRSTDDILPVSTVYPSIEEANCWISGSVSAQFQESYEVVEIKAVTP